MMIFAKSHWQLIYLIYIYIIIFSGVIASREKCLVSRGPKKTFSNVQITAR
jgi:hypothetical protein